MSIWERSWWTLERMFACESTTAFGVPLDPEVNRMIAGLSAASSLEHWFSFRCERRDAFHIRPGKRKASRKTSRAWKSFLRDSRTRISMPASCKAFASFSRFASLRKRSDVQTVRIFAVLQVLRRFFEPREKLSRAAHRQAAWRPKSVTTAALLLGSMMPTAPSVPSTSREESVRACATSLR